MQRIYSKLLLLTLFSTSIVAQEQIGVAAAVNRNTTDLTLEQERKLVEAGYQIIQNHTIETDEIGKAQMLLLDGTAFSVGPNSSVVLDRFIYNPATAEGSLEVTARGLLRIVGGKVTKKQPALIRTNSATVGIRGGIGIVQTDGSKVNATFLYGEEMTVTPNCVDLDTFGDQCSNDFITTITEPGFSVSVESADSEPSEPEPVTEESLEAVQDELEASEEEPAEEESSSDESSSEESSEESSSEESSDESSSEESSDESSDESSSDDSSSEESSSDESSSDESSSEESSSDESVASDDTSDSSSDEPTTEVAQDTETETTTEVADAGDSSDIEVNEDLLDSSGVSDVSSDVAPDELGTADSFEVETEVDLVDVDDSPAEDVNEEVADTAQETTAEVAPTEVAPIFEVEIAALVESVDENTTEISLTEFVLVNPGEQNYTVNIAGEGSEAFTYNQETNALELNTAADYETQEAYDLTVTFTSDNGDVQTVDLELAVADVDEAATVDEIALINTISETAISAELVANQVNVSETVNAGTVIATFSATDPEGNTLEYSLSGTYADQFTVNTAGEVSLAGSLDYETTSVVTLMLEVSDGVHTTLQEIVINVVNDDEPAAIATSFVDSAVAESVAIGAVIGTVNATDPEGNSVTYSLSGTGSDNFSVDANGNITVVNSLDYESASAYELTLVVDDGTYAATETLTISVADVNEAPSLSTAVAFNAFQENTATGTTIATSTVTDPEAAAITYSLSGTGSENFAVSSDGTVTLANSLDYETATAYEITLTANDGANSVSQTITVNVGDINEAPSVSLTVAAASVAEDVSTGTSIATSSVSDPESDNVSYTLGGVGSSNFSVDSNGTVTVANSLDYETQTSYELTLTVSDGTSSTQETFQISITDVPDSFALALSSNSPSINEGVSTGTQVATSTLTQQDSAAVTYSLSGTNSNKFAISNTGVITTAAAMDYETTSSYSLTVTVTDGTNTDTETINITINDQSMNTLAVSLANSGAALLESSSSGTAVASSSINNPDSDSITYTLSGTGSSNFSVDSSGNVTTNATLDFETAKSYALTLTATAGSTSVTDTFTVNVGNVAELNAAVLRYSADYNSVSRSGFSATATRGPSGSSLPAYYLEQVGISSTTNFNDVFDHDGNTDYNVSPTVRVEIGGGSQLNFEYVFPITSIGSVAGVYAPSRYGSSLINGTNIIQNTVQYNSLLGTTTSTEARVDATDVSSIDNQQIISAGTFMAWSGSGTSPNTSTGGDFAFMTTNRAAANITYNVGGSINGTNAFFEFLNGNNLTNVESIIDDDFSTYAISGVGNSTCQWSQSTCINENGDTLTWIRDFSLLWFHKLGNNHFSNSTYQSRIINALTNGATVVILVGEHSGGCCGGTSNWAGAVNLFNALGWSGHSNNHLGGMTSYSDNRMATINPSSSYPNSWIPYSTMPTHISWAAAGLLTIPSVCTGLTTGNSLFICDPTATGLSGTLIGYADTNVWSYFNLTNGSLQRQDSSSCPSTPCDNTGMVQWISAIAQTTPGGTATYNLFEDQTTLAGQIYTDAMWDTFVGCTSGSCSSKFAEGILYFAVLPVEYLGTSFNLNSDNWFYPNFMPMTNSNIWTYGDVGLRYCGPGASAGSECAAYEYNENYEWQSLALNPSSSSFLHTTAREWAVGGNDIPEGSSFFKQMVRYDGVGVGMWAQISFADSYADDSDASNIRDDQQSLLNVVITNMNRRSNMTSMYSAGDTGFGMDGYHYWSYQGATNANDNGLGIVYGTSPVECATSNETACFWAPDAKDSNATSAPSAMFLTSSDPYASGDMGLSVSYNANTDAFLTGSFNQALIRQNVKNGNGNTQANTYTSTYRGSFQNQYSTPSSLSSGTLGWSGYFNGILEFDVSGASNNQFASIGTGSTRASFTFDYGTNFAEVVAPIDITAFASNNYTANWTTVDTGSMTLTFGDLDNTDAKSAFLANNVFAAEIQDNGTQIDGTSGGSNNLAGVMVTWQSLDNPDTTLYEGMSNANENSSAQGGGDAFSDPGGSGHYTKWGFWAMSSADIAVATGDQNASVHLGTWVGGEIIDQSLIPTSGTASKSGGAVFNVAYRHNASGNDYDVHKYTSTADVDATFTWGTSGYSGNLTFKDFDEKNPILVNAGFLDVNGWFTVAIAGTDQHYSGSLTPSLQNGWSGLASVKGSIFGGEYTQYGTTTTYIESGGNISVDVYKTGDSSTAGANDFYTAEGIYLLY